MVNLYKRPIGRSRVAIFLSLALMPLSACTLPTFDVEYAYGGPTTTTIEQRIRCELVDMIKSDDFQKGQFATLLAEGDYVTTMNLTLKTTRSGELAPSLSFPNVGPRLSIGAGLKYSNIVSRTSYKKLRYSLKELRKEWLNNREYGACPEGVGYNITGNLGLQDLVRTLLTSRSTNTSAGVGGKEEFGGTISFTVTRNINSAGPTWKLTDFVGPGGLGKLEKKTVNQLDIAFAKGSKPSDRPGVATVTDAAAADAYLTEIILLGIDLRPGS